MYQMCAEWTPDRSGLLWHVLAKEAAAGTLCGRQPELPESAVCSDGVVEHYCVDCMTAFRSVVQGGSGPAREQAPA
ncbi:hypothetical protein [Streptomyces sp. NPDC012888]|uniref:hypothetical protein n=1 Tax=Streptomyces sp. NPDC012888 TaxID=3364855 RepID=UPI0036BD6522